MLSSSDYSMLVRFRQPADAEDRRDPRFLRLLEEHFICVHSYDPAFANHLHSSSVPLDYIVTPKGEDALEEYEQFCQDRAEQRRQQAHDHAQARIDKRKQFRHDWIVGLVGAAVGAVITLVIEQLVKIFV